MWLRTISECTRPSEERNASVLLHRVGEPFYDETERRWNSHGRTNSSQCSEHEEDDLVVTEPASKREDTNDCRANDEAPLWTAGQLMQRQLTRIKFFFWKTH